MVRAARQPSTSDSGRARRLGPRGGAASGAAEDLGGGETGRLPPAIHSRREKHRHEEPRYSRWTGPSTGERAVASIFAPPPMASMAGSASAAKRRTSRIRDLDGILWRAGRAPRCGRRTTTVTAWKRGFAVRPARRCRSRGSKRRRDDDPASSSSSRGYDLPQRSSAHSTVPPGSAQVPVSGAPDEQPAGRRRL